MWIARESSPTAVTAGLLSGPGKGDPVHRMRSVSPFRSRTARFARYTGRLWAASGLSCLVNEKTVRLARNDAPRTGRVTEWKTPHLPGRFQGARLACWARHSGRSRQWDVRVPVERRPQPPARARTRGREEDLPTQHTEAGQEPRFPAPDVDARRPCHRPRPAAQGSPPPVCVRAARRKRSGASGIGPLSRRCGARRSAPAPGR